MSEIYMRAVEDTLVSNIDPDYEGKLSELINNLAVSTSDPDLQSCVITAVVRTGDRLETHVINHGLDGTGYNVIQIEAETEEQINLFNDIADSMVTAIDDCITGLSVFDPDFIEEN